MKYRDIELFVDRALSKFIESPLSALVLAVVVVLLMSFGARMF
jgi:hypothetical protein